MPTIVDEEFGTIVVRRSAQATRVRIRVAPDGTLRASLPMYAPMLMLKRLIKSSREELRALLENGKHGYVFEDGMQIGKSHTLLVQTTNASHVAVRREQQRILVRLPAGQPLHHPEVDRAIRDVVINALRIEAKSYLPKRLSYLADALGYHYEKVRFSHSSGRWGSCSTSGTISLNIALMKLPHELIDYVLIHELSHTVQMNHSQEFWQLVAAADANYKKHRKELKLHTPMI